MGCSWSGWPVEDVALGETVMVEVPEGVTMGGGGVIDALPPPHPARANVMQRMAAERAPQRARGLLQAGSGDDYVLALEIRPGRVRAQLAGVPAGMAGEEPVHEANVVADENPKTQAEKARAEDEAAVEPFEAMAGKRKRQGQRGGDQHHAGDGADAEDEQIQQRPLGIANRA